MNIDIIIPAYNAKDTLFKTLSSIAIQRDIDRFSVYLINDCSDYQYDSFVHYFSQFYPIQEIVSSENVGPGGARNLGINAGKGKYIVFIDSDDYFYSPFSLHNLFSKIEEGQFDIVISNFICERDGISALKKKNPVWLHGKIYRRAFIEKHHVSFNLSRANEDNGFNRLLLLLGAKIYYYDETTYVYAENEFSITRKNNRQYRVSGLEGFTYNMNWAMQEALERNCSKISIGKFSLSVLVTMYFYYLDLGLHSKTDGDHILQWTKKCKDIFDLYGSFITKEDIENSLSLKEKEYLNENKKLNKTISFDEFLLRVGDIDD